MNDRTSIEPGLLRHRLTIVTATETSTNEMGEAITSTATAGRWGSVRTLTPREVANAATLSQDVTHEIKMRYTAAISSANQIQWNSRTFNIIGINNVEERNVLLIMQCKENTINA